MDQETRNKLQTATQELRQLLETEFSEQLAGTFDIAANGKVAAEAGPHLDASQQLVRRKLVEAIEHAVDGGKKSVEAVEDISRETAFTFLNRFVALRMLEARGLLQPCVSKGDQSSGFKEFCGLAPGLTSLQDGGYRLYLECLFDELSVEIKVLFDRRDAASLLWPRRNALAKLLKILGRKELEAAWSADETIGWVYQFFNELEKKEVFDRLYKRKQKIRARDIPAATQIFTPNWMVRFLVENTIGRLWVEMHPDSQLAASLGYLVPNEKANPVPLKSVRSIRMLDPSCGTMHFGLVAFDLFVEMYREEIANAGKNGWPDKAPVDSENDIPTAILAHNLHGIDIDLRAVQLSALTLFLKAKSLNPNVTVAESKLACADIHMLNGEHLGEFLSAAGLDKRPIYGRILKAMQQRFQNADQLGSLLRMEAEIRQLVQEERKRYEKEGRQRDLFGWSKEQFESEAGQREFWETLEIQIGQALDAFAREQAERGRDQSFFFGETTKGLRLLELMNQRYDIVVTNPPYMTARNMNDVLKGYVAKEYPAAKSDLYAAFIQRCVEWLVDQGRMGMVTQQSFMFISSYEKLRELLRDQVSIETLPHVGPRAFEEISGEKVNTTLLVLRRETDETARNESVGTYFRLVKQPDAESKRKRFEEAVATMRSSGSDSVVYRYKQADLDAIPGSPWVYWASETLRNLFVTCSCLEFVYPAKEGINTGDNERFLRFWWETAQQASRSSINWCRIAKGTESIPYVNPPMYICNADIMQMSLLSGSAMRNRDCFFKPAITFLSNSSSRFCAWLTNEGQLFCSTGGRSLFPDTKVRLALLGLLNSSLCDNLLSLINPTITVKVGDLNRLPIPPEFRSEELINAVEEMLSLHHAKSVHTETSYEFSGPERLAKGSENVVSSQERTSILEKKIDELVLGLYGLGKYATRKLHLDFEEIELECDEQEEPDQGDNSSVQLLHESALNWVAYGVGIVVGRFYPGKFGELGCGDFPKEVSHQLRSLADTDGVMTLDAGHPHDLAAKVLQSLTLMLGDDDVRHCINEATGRDGDLEEELRRYLAGSFFKDHIQKYRKRPVYWLLQSPRKSYGVYLFHERVTKDTLYRLRSDQFAGSRLKLLNSRVANLQRQAEGAQGSKLKRLQKEIEEAELARDDLQEFVSKLDDLIALGYQPHIDDGVLINMAPLWPLLPSWSAEPKKCWKKLVAGDYDWSHMAMHLWPERVIPKCVESASYAIAHELDEVFWTQDDRDRFQPQPEPDGGWQRTIDQLVAERKRPGVANAVEKLIAEGARAAPKRRRGRKRQ